MRREQRRFPTRQNGGGSLMFWGAVSFLWGFAFGSIEWEARLSVLL